MFLPSVLTLLAGLSFQSPSVAPLPDPLTPRTQDIAYPRVILDRAKTRASVAKSTLRLPEVTLGMKYLLVWEGAPLDNLGGSVSWIEDVDGDGRPDCVLGSGQWRALAEGHGPGYVCVASSASGQILYRVDGIRRKIEGDAFGLVTCTIPDRDGDHVSELALGAWKFNGYTGFVSILSGKSGKLLQTWLGGSTDRDCENGFCGDGFGLCLSPLGDRTPALLVSDGHKTFVCRSSVEQAQASVPGFVLGSAGDVDGDGVAEFVVAHGAPPDDPAGSEQTGELVLVSGSNCTPLREGRCERDGRVPACAPVLTTTGKHGTVVSALRPRIDGSDDVRKLFVTSFSVGEWTQTTCIACEAPEKLELRHLWSAGDLDGDGVEEVVIVWAGQGGARLLILDPEHGHVLGAFDSPNWEFGSSFSPVRSASRMSTQQLLIGEGRGSASLPGGRVYLVSVSTPR